MPKWEPKENPTETELAWAAGIVDGEGCICIYGRHGRVSKKGVHALQLIVNVTNTDPRMPIKMKEIFGGHLTGSVERRNNPRRRPCMVWTITGKPAGSALVKMMPYLVVKREQAEVAVAYVGTIGGGGKLADGVSEHRESLRGQLVLLKGRIA